jgi:hypothetical protein
MSMNNSPGGHGINEKIILKWILRKKMQGCELDLTDSDRVQ